MSTTIHTWLPVFPGFYNTGFEPSCYNDYNIGVELIESELIAAADYDVCCPAVKMLIERMADSYNPEFVELDIYAYEDEVAKECVAVINNMLTNDFGFIKKLTFEGVVRPAYYNFSNDSINISVEVDDDFDDKALEFILRHSKEFEQYLKSHYTAYDGFSPAYSNEMKDWVWDFDNDRLDEHQYGAILEFMLTLGDTKEEELITEDLLSEISTGWEFYSIPDAIKELLTNPKVKELIHDLEKQWSLVEEYRKLKPEYVKAHKKAIEAYVDETYEMILDIYNKENN